MKMMNNNQEYFDSNVENSEEIVDYHAQNHSRENQSHPQNLQSLQNPQIVDVNLLRLELGTALRNLDQLKQPDGLPTGIESFDNFLLWRGVPKGEISLFIGKPGAGSTSLWLNIARQVHAHDKWAAWINSSWKLLPSTLIKRKLNLNRLLVVNEPKEPRQLFWVLEEMISSCLFDLIGCHLQDFFLKSHQLKKLKKLARLHQVALVLVSHLKNWKIDPLFSLVVECRREFFTFRRALHRPTPFVISAHSIFNELNRDVIDDNLLFLKSIRERKGLCLNYANTVS